MIRKAPPMSTIDTETFKKIIGEKLEKSQLMERGLRTAEELEKNAKELTELFIAAAMESRKKKPERTKRNLAPWWTPKLEEMQAKGIQICREMPRLPTQESRLKHKEHKAEYQREVRKAKATSFKEFCTTNMNQDLYTALKSISGEESSRTEPGEVRVNGHTTTDPINIMEAFADRFFHREPPSTQQHKIVEEAARKYLSPKERPVPPPISVKEMRSAMKKLRKTAAPGQDGISLSLINLALNLIEPHLLNFTMQALRSAYSQMCGRKQRYQSSRSQATRLPRNREPQANKCVRCLRKNTRENNTSTTHLAGR